MWFSSIAALVGRRLSVSFGRSKVDERSLVPAAGNGLTGQSRTTSGLQLLLKPQCVERSEQVGRNDPVSFIRG